MLALFGASSALLLSPAQHASSCQQAPVVRHVSRSSAISCQVRDLPTGWKEVTDKDSGKPYYYNAATGVTQWQKPMAERFGVEGDSNTRTLTPASTWRMKLDVTAPKTSGKFATIQANVRFAEEDGFEPPQGFMTVESCVPEGALKLGQQQTRWQLSEDPEDRKDSLWIWGLFKEPLYPFILFELELAEPLEIAEGISIPQGKLYFQVDHRRKEGEVKLGEGTITYKIDSEQNADLLGLSQFTYNEPVPCGQVRFLDTA